MVGTMEVVLSLAWTADIFSMAFSVAEEDKRDICYSIFKTVPFSPSMDILKIPSLIS